MADTKNKRERGIWSAYTPQSTPFKYQVDDTVFLPLPSLKALEKFIEETTALDEFYKKGGCLYNDEDEPLDIIGAIFYLHQRRYARWLERQESN